MPNIKNLTVYCWAWLSNAMCVASPASLVYHWYNWLAVINYIACVLYWYYWHIDISWQFDQWFSPLANFALLQTLEPPTYCNTKPLIDTGNTIWHCSNVTSYSHLKYFWLRNTVVCYGYFYRFKILRIWPAVLYSPYAALYFPKSAVWKT